MYAPPCPALYNSSWSFILYLPQLQNAKGLSFVLTDSQLISLFLHFSRLSLDHSGGTTDYSGRGTTQLQPSVLQNEHGESRWLWAERSQVWWQMVASWEALRVVSQVKEANYEG